MAVAVTYPGVYVQEVPSGVRSIAGVSTSVTMFIGRTVRGALNTPTRLFGFADFDRAFANDSSVGDMARYVKLFFTNGGTDCYVMRIAEGATTATMQMQAEDGTAVLEFTAKQAGAIGNSIRARVTYPSTNSEGTFSIEMWRNETTSTGTVRKADLEEFKNLSMNTNSANFAPDILSQRSKLVNAVSLVVANGKGGFSQAGRPVPYKNASASTIRNRLEDVFNDQGSLRLTIGGNQVTVDLQPVTTPRVTAASINAVFTDFALRLTTKITDALPDDVAATATFETGPTPIAGDGDKSVYLRISADDKNHDAIVRPAPNSRDLAVFLMMGADQGGLEVSAHAHRRPAPNGISIEMRDDDTVLELAGAQQDSITEVSLPEQQLDGTWAPVSIPVDLVITNAGDPIYRADADLYPDENANGLRLALATIRDAINDYREANAATFPWVAELWGFRLAVWPNGAAGDLLSGVLTSSDGAAAGTDLGTLSTVNVKHYVVGPGATQGLQVAGVAGDDGNPPTVAEYEAAFPIIDRQVDIFNLMVLPPTGDPALNLPDVYRPASVFCQQRRAFLIMDAPLDWTSAQLAGTGVAALRIGLVKDFSAIYYPRLQIVESGRRHFVGPSGAMAGVMARTDGSRGVWKAPAGVEADIRGVTGVEYPLSDPENGVTNPRAINTIRQFPTGVVSWGARTMDGDNDAGSEWKYIPIRRLALYIEESLYRGLKWVVFEPNDEPLWAQIRLNLGAFMHGLFRQGAFQGAVKSDAYFVKCDAETTPQADRDLGIVNIWVGFAPLKPAEFVVLYLQQIAGQIET